MSSLLLRLVVLFALVCAVIGESSSSSSSSTPVPIIVAPSSSSSSSEAAAVSSSSSAGLSSGPNAATSSATSAMQFSSSPSSTASPWMPSSSSSSSSATSPDANNTMSSSSSSSIPAPMLLTPVIYSLSDCNSANTNGTNLTSCDGATGQSVITISGANFTTPATASLTCTLSYSLTLITPNTNATILVNTPKLDTQDINTPCSLTVTNSGNIKSNTVALSFVTYSTDLEDAFKFLGLTLMNLIIAASVIGVVVLVVFVLCMLSCCCGVSLACLNCCRSRPSTVVISPQSSGYTSMA